MSQRSRAPCTLAKNVASSILSTSREGCRPRSITTPFDPILAVSISFMEEH